MNRREFLSATPLLLAGCGSGADMADYTIMPSPARSGYYQGISAPGFGEGVWTPSLLFDSNNTGMTSSLQSGSWVRIGRMVTAWFTITLTAKGSSTGTAAIGNVPFQASVTGLGAVASFTAAWWQNMTSSFVVIGVIPSTVARQFIVYGATAAATSIAARTHADFADNTTFAGHTIYLTDD